MTNMFQGHQESPQIRNVNKEMVKEEREEQKEMERNKEKENREAVRMVTINEGRVGCPLRISLDT